jgi:Spy/CpxP family protein refolding chaperone
MNLKAMIRLALTGALLSLPAAAQESGDILIERHGGPPPLPPLPPMPPPPPGLPMMMALPPPAHGIPAHVVQKLGLSKELVQKIQDITFESNEQLINLEADLKRAQLELDKLLRAASPNENAVLQQVEAVGRAETAVRRNRIGLMLQIKRLLGPDNWQKLEAELGDMRREIRILRRGPGEDGETLLLEKKLIK